MCHAELDKTEFRDSEQEGGAGLAKCYHVGVVRI